MTDRFVSPCKPPEGLERELLTILIEECSEVQKRATKAMRFGLEEVQPGQSLNNVERLSEEIGDLLCVLDRLKPLGLLYQPAINRGYERKVAKLAKFVQSEDFR